MEWLQEFRPALLQVFAHHRPVEWLVRPLGRLYVKIKINFSSDDIDMMDLTISPDDSMRVHQGCHLGVIRTDNPVKPWGEYVHRHTVEKGYNIRADYNFTLKCTEYPRQHVTDFLFALWFFILKLHARFFEHEDYVIADSDQAMIGDILYKYLKLDPTLGYHEMISRPILYYERFGFVYPEKQEWVRNYLTSGHAFVVHRGRDEEILEMYIDLKNVSFNYIYRLANNVIFDFFEHH